MPHGYSYHWNPGLVWLHVISDLLITLAYMSIPITLVHFVRKRRDLPFDWMFLCFGVFIMACGATHAMEVWNLWHGAYWLAGVLKAITAFASVPTAVLLLQLVPKALALPSPEDARKANKALVRAKEEAERASRFKDQFLSTMSHELRTPLNSVLGFSALLAEERYGTLNERQARYVSHIHNGGQHLLNLINDILDLSKIEAGRLELAIENVAVATAFAEVTSTLRSLVEKKSQTLSQFAATGLAIRADSTRFKQVLMNLVGNAIKFSPAGGRIELVAHKTDGQVRVEVRDTGPGIPPQEQKRIFDAFYRFSQSGEATEGTGLGLAITQRLVELQGGQLGLQSQPGQGSCFFFALPAATALRQASPRISEAGAKVRAAGRGPTLPGSEGRRATQAAYPGDRRRYAHPRSHHRIAHRARLRRGHRCRWCRGPRPGSDFLARTGDSGLVAAEGKRLRATGRMAGQPANRRSSRVHPDQQRLDPRGRDTSPRACGASSAQGAALEARPAQPAPASRNAESSRDRMKLFGWNPSAGRWRSRRFI